MTRRKDTLFDWLFAWFAVACIAWLLTGGIPDQNHIVGAVIGAAGGILFYVILWRIIYHLFIKRREEQEWLKQKKRLEKQLKNNDQ